MSRPAEFLLDVALVAGVGFLALRFASLLLVLTGFLLLTVALMVFERAVR